VPTICAAVALSVSSVYAIHGAAAPRVPGACPSAQHHAPMASYRTMNLREEINHCRGGEDNCTTIKHNRERHRDIKGRNLERDFDLPAPVSAR
jgi:hypothetical protein